MVFLGLSRAVGKRISSEAEYYCVYVREVQVLFLDAALSLLRNCYRDDLTWPGVIRSYVICALAQVRCDDATGVQQRREHDTSMTRDRSGHINC